MMIDLNRVKSADALGEMLRSYAFLDNGYGASSTFDLEPEFKPVDPASEKGHDLISLLACGGDTDEIVYTATKTYDGSDDKGILWSNGTLDVAWFWDGDGTLVFQFGETSLVNGDCKCDYGWSFVRPMGLLDIHPDYGRSLQPTIAMKHPIYGKHNRIILAINTLTKAEKFDLMSQLEPIYQRILTHARLRKNSVNIDAELSVFSTDIRDLAERLLTKYPKARDCNLFRKAIEILGASEEKAAA